MLYAASQILNCKISACSSPVAFGYIFIPPRRLIIKSATRCNLRRSIPVLNIRRTKKPKHTKMGPWSGYCEVFQEKETNTQMARNKQVKGKEERKKELIEDGKK
jgi:hypothetical protein